MLKNPKRIIRKINNLEKQYSKTNPKATLLLHKIELYAAKLITRAKGIKGRSV